MSAPLTDAEIAELRKLSADHYWTEGDRDELRKSLPRVLDFAERARKLLTRIEWMTPGGNEPARCQFCWATKSDGHASLCRLAALLGPAPRTSSSSLWTSGHWLKAMHCDSCGFFILTQPTLCKTRENHGASKYEEACVYSVGAFLRRMAE